MPIHTKILQNCTGQGKIIRAEDEDFAVTAAERHPKPKTSDHMLNVNKQCRQRNIFHVRFDQQQLIDIFY
jgi:hypothetical protein